MSVFAKFGKWFRGFREALKPPPEPPPPEFKLEPNRDGKYDLYRYKDSVFGYWVVKHDVESEEEARKIIANLKRPVIGLKNEP